MKKTIQGVLLSGLVFPGLGQIALGKKGLGAAFILGTNVGLAGIILSVIKRIPLILEQIQPELDRGTLDIRRMIDITVQSTGTGNHVLETVGITIITGCWIAAVGHAYWLGRQQDATSHVSK